MGFGLLFIGYFLTVMNIPIFGLLGTLIRACGIAIMFIAVFKLSKYNRAFNVTAIGVALMALITAVLLFIDVNELMYNNLLVSNKVVTPFAQKIVGYVEQGVSFVFTTFLLWGIWKIAKETEVKKISTGAIRNFIFSCMYCFMYLLSFVPTKGIQSVQSEFALIVWILYFVNIVLNIILLFSCYANICDEEDVEMERKPSKISFLNRLYDENARRMKKAREEDELYRQEKRQRREEKKKKRRGK